jgi:undecaprenyl-diphosphatase
VALVSFLIYRFKDKRYLNFFLSNVLISMGIVYLLKMVFDTKRPTDSIISAFGASFPSYHATISTVFFLSIIFIFKNFLHGFNLKILHILGFLMIFLVSISRIYLGVHWFSDVLFGVMLGVVIHHISIHIFRKYQ